MPASTPPSWWMSLAAAALVPPVAVQVLNAHLAGFSPAEWQQLIGLLTRLLANGDALREPA